MTTKVRFAPSPTGKIHVGNVRTATLNWLFARATGGRFLLRIDDTDLERSTAAAEALIYEDLAWLGLSWDETFRQSDRFAHYDEAVARLKAAGRLYPCYETAEELERKRKIALSLDRPPVYDRAALRLTDGDRRALEAAGRRPHWRFLLSGGTVEWTDLVRGAQSIETSSLSDPVLVREDGSYLYTLPSVVDDVEASITHILRGEDHVTNSAAQIEIFEALGAAAPAMGHTPLLLGADGQALSKRLGSLSIQQLREEGFEPMAVLSHLAKLGTSDPIELKASVDVLAAEFDFAKIGRAPARFDERDLEKLNAAHVHGLGFDAAAPRLRRFAHGGEADAAFWETVKPNLSRVPDVAVWLAIVYAGGLVGPELSPEDRAFVGEAARLFPAGEATEATWGEWTERVKAATGRKGRALYQPLRRVLTDQEHGPEMGPLLALIGAEKARLRLEAAAE